jgi:hypothetical protein
MKYLQTYENVKEENEIEHILTTECRPFLEFGHIFYRGFNNYPSNKFRFFTNTIRNYKLFTSVKTRQPLDTPLEIHKKINKLFFEKFGWYARSEGIFATPNGSITKQYGKTYLFVPVGDFEYLYNPVVTDFYVVLRNKNFLEPEYWLTMNKKTNIDDYYTALDKTLNELVDGYRDTGYNPFVESIFKCDKYYLINTKYLKTVKKLFYK